MEFSDILSAYTILKSKHCKNNCDKCKFSTTRPDEIGLFCLLDEMADAWHLPRFTEHKVIKSAQFQLKCNCHEFEDAEYCTENKCWLYSHDLECCLADLFDDNDDDNKIIFHF